MPGALTVNGLKVSQTKELSDGTLVLVVENLLFNWRDRVHRAFDELQVWIIPFVSILYIEQKLLRA